MFDVIIVGSGAGGAMSAYELTRRGLKVLLLEAGRDYDPLAETAMFNTPEQAPLRGSATPDKPFGYYDATVGGGWEVPGEPYTVAPGSEPFRWWRPRMLGGRTNHWARVSLRLGPYDFKPFSRDGLGVDWPIAYDDVAPWYDKVEKLIGVTGGPAQNLENTPDPPADCMQPTPPPRAHEILLTRAFASMGIPTAPIHAAILTRPLNGRPACIYATPCIRGCSIGANFQSPNVLLPEARATGNLTVRTNAMVYSIDTDAKGQASGVRFVDKQTEVREIVSARAIILAASSCESARILLNSRSEERPSGLANESGLVGRNLMDTVGTKVVARIPALDGLPLANDDGMSINHIYVPWWGYAAQSRGELDFARGYHIEFGGGRTMPAMNLADVLDESEISRGSFLRAELRRRYGSMIRFSTRGEMIPNENSYCDIDPGTRDRYGIPVLRFHWKWGVHETRQAAHAVDTVVEVVEKMGGSTIGTVERDGAKAISRGGEIIHEVGTARMGSDPRHSVTDAFGRSWSVRNLFVNDGATMCSSPDKNPTLTILALAWRNSDHLARLFEAGEL